MRGPWTILPFLLGVLAVVTGLATEVAANDCCIEHGTPSCSDYGISLCVCAQDSYCCTFEWDAICVDEVTSLGCGNCGGNGGPGDCCTVHDYAGCSNSAIASCVCMSDSYCCSVMWDSICAGEVEQLGCGSCTGCTPSCGGKQCGDDGCGGSCGSCPGGTTCNAWGICEQSCLPNCVGKQCGADGCGGSCGTCTGGTFCNVQGVCESTCQPNCANKECGADGCGGECGACGFGEICDFGLCKAMCQADCTGKQCGDDGCGGSCGTCGGGTFCNSSGLCVQNCTPSCAGKQCGDDGCGGSCGSCGFGMSCNAAGICITECPKQCDGKECGPDGCGGSCGSCGPGWVCSTDGLCETAPADCVPDCLGRECGPDGCGGECGVCGSELACSDGLCVVPRGGASGDEESDAWPAGTTDLVVGAQADVWHGGGPPTSGPCAPGEKLWYGKCLPEESIYGQDKELVYDGCSASPRPGNGGLAVGLLLLLLLALRRCSHLLRYPRIG